MFKYLIMNLKSDLEYKASFILNSIAQFFVFLMYCITFYSLFEKFGMLKGFNINQVILCFSVVQFGQSFSEALLRGFDRFCEIIKNGNFDLLLIRPQNIFLQIMGTKFEFTKMVKSLFSIILLVYACIKLQIFLSPIKIIIVLLMLIGSTAVFSAVLIFGAAMCFVTIEGLEIVNIFMYGTRDFAQYPIGAYNKIVQSFFIYIIPIGLASFFPMLYVTGLSTNIWFAVMPLVCILTLIPACLVFSFGVKKYKSTGS